MILLTGCTDIEDNHCIFYNKVSRIMIKHQNCVHFVLFVCIIIHFFALFVSADGETPLPAGLEEKPPSTEEEPALPMGLENTAKPEEPALPEGLSLEQPEKKKAEEKEERFADLPFDLSGFWEARAGFRTLNDPHENESSIGETRLQVKIDKALDYATLKLTGDLVYDPLLNQHDIHLEKGRGFIDLREMSLLLRPASFMDIKAGRQILTWGTGDLIFINDLFPKDWNSFFIGRDTEYLKAPSDAAKISLFSNVVNLDLIYTPRFDTDRFIDGSRISFYNSKLGKMTGRDAIEYPIIPDNWFDDDEVALRFYKNIGPYEAALYGYRGFWKSPAGTDSVSGKSTFPELSVYGGSIRGPMGKGIGNIETGYYNSEDDTRGSNASVRNSEFRFLTGYEQELARDFTAGVQYYLEHIIDYSNYLSSLPSGSPASDENRHVLTLRLTKFLAGQNLMLSLFTFYSPSDNDTYLRPKIHYKIDDHWSAEAGGNIFAGKDRFTFFGQFEKNSNIYAGMRYGF